MRAPMGGGGGGGAPMVFFFCRFYIPSSTIEDRNFIAVFCISGRAKYQKKIQKNKNAKKNHKLRNFRNKDLFSGFFCRNTFLQLTKNQLFKRISKMSSRQNTIPKFSIKLPSFSISGNSVSPPKNS